MAAYRQKLKGFNQKNELSLFLLYEPQVDYLSELCLSKKVFKF